MKINDTGAFPTPTSRFYMYLDTTQQSGNFPSELNEVSIISSPTEVDASKGHSLVIVDAPAKAAIAAAKRKMALDSSTCALWVQRSNSDVLEKLILAGNELAIAGMNLTDEWVQFRIQSAVEADRKADDLLQGLRIPRLVVPTPQVTVGGAEVVELKKTDRLRDKAISLMIPPAKAVKPYLPTRVVVALYKTLDKIR